jgi:hypothetical protein
MSIWELLLMYVVLRDGIMLRFPDHIAGTWDIRFAFSLYESGKTKLTGFGLQLG